ncbi:MAG: CsgG/HfaB family protein, partial [Salinibacter sp.]
MPRRRSSAALLALLTGAILLLGGCASMDPAFETRDAHPGLESTVHDSMTMLPQPASPVVTAVYQFRDQTGQYKRKERGSTFSRAVTQGGTAILMDALADSDWFRPIERKGLSNLTQERDIIRSIRQQYEGDRAQPLSPLLFAGILLEGGIIGFDSNVISGGGGFRLFSIGGSGEYRRNQVTVYLRAVSTQTGEVLKTVHTTKTIISQQLQGSATRFIAPNLFLETEAGISYNEPKTLAVTEAIDAAVRDLTIEGMRDGLFSPADTAAARAVIDRYEESKARAAQRDYFDRLLQPDNRSGLGVEVGGGGNILQGDVQGTSFNPSGALALRYPLSPRWALGLQNTAGRISAAGDFGETVLSTELNMTYYFAPRAQFTPFLRASGGVVTQFPEPYRLTNTASLLGGGSVGVEYMVNEDLGVSTAFEVRYTIDDALDNERVGSFNDSLWG